MSRAPKCFFFFDAKRNGDKNLEIKRHLASNTWGKIYLLATAWLVGSLRRQQDGLILALSCWNAWRLPFRERSGNTCEKEDKVICENGVDKKKLWRMDVRRGRQFFSQPLMESQHLLHLDHHHLLKKEKKPIPFFFFAPNLGKLGEFKPGRYKPTDQFFFDRKKKKKKGTKTGWGEGGRADVARERSQGNALSLSPFPTLSQGKGKEEEEAGLPDLARSQEEKSDSR